ncbi:MAG: TIGR04211 family SH3 domain-containing protein [Gammaproteobacteria bacterium]|nr:TIGR04211 family SH3 domain-containing protein [Gammaproteobacteria bacterium]
MKKISCLLLASSLTFQTLAASVWVSDEVEAPLRSAPELNSKIVSLLKAGQKVSVIDQNDKYIKVKTADGSVGWLSNYYVLREESVHAKFAPMQSALAKAKQQVQTLRSELDEKKSLIAQLQADVNSTKKNASEAAERAKSSESGATKLLSDNESLQQKLSEQNTLIKKLTTALDAAKQKATDANTKYYSLVKVSENAVDIDKQNRSLQEKAVFFEQEIQKLKTENQSLKAKIGKKEFIVGALTVLGSILVGYVLSVMMPPRGRRRSSSSYSSSL